MLGAEHGDFRCVPEFLPFCFRNDLHDPVSETHPFPLAQRMAGDRCVRNLSQRTIDAYTYHVDRFARFFDKSLEQLGPEEIRTYQLHLIEERKASWSAFNQAVCGLRFLDRVTLPRPWVVQQVPFGKRPKRLPRCWAPKKSVSCWHVYRCSNIARSC